MTWISDAAIAHLRVVADWPDFTNTRYDAIEEIGRGGMGTIYRARDRELHRDVAIKVCAPSGDGSDDRLRQEAQVLAALEHPGIVPVHECGRLPDGRAYYVMLLVKGERLDVCVRRLPLVSDRLRLFDRLCDIIAFAHAQGFIHRDLKPANVMVGAFGDVLVMDWGLARRVAPAEADAARDVRAAAAGGSGTEGYMAPEQRDGSADVRSDIYSLGIILDELTTGLPPRARPLTSIIRHAAAPRPDDRYAAVTDLAADVRRFADGQRVLAHEEHVFERTVRLVRMYRTPLALVGAYLLMRIVFALWW
jgi:eukaryotic-like serine/threonine-protein kinase